LIGLKSDLRDDANTIDRLKQRDQKPITFEEGSELAEKLGFVDYMECSALTGEGVDEVRARAIEILVSQPTQRKKKSSACQLI
jgi:GTPase SAR1 family protein